MARRKGTDAFGVMNGTDARAAARTSIEAERAKVAQAMAAVPMPAQGASYETWLAWYESIAPGGEFNEALAQGEVDAFALYGGN